MPTMRSRRTLRMNPPEYGAKDFLVEHRERFVFIGTQPGPDLDDARDSGVRYLVDDHVCRAEFPSEEHGRNAATGRIGTDYGVRALRWMARFAVELFRGTMHFFQSLVDAACHVMMRAEPDAEPQS